MQISLGTTVVRNTAQQFCILHTVTAHSPWQQCLVTISYSLHATIGNLDGNLICIQLLHHTSTTDS